jgi:hypothetical protein
MRPHSFYLAIALAGAGIGFGGCDSDGLSPRETQSQNYSSYVYSQFNGDALVLPTTRPEIRGPITVTVIQAGEVAPPRAMLDELQSHQALFARVESLPGIFDPPNPRLDYMPFNSPYQRGNVNRASLALYGEQLTLRHLHQMRQAALDLDTQYVLLMGGIIDHSNNSTPLSLADITIVGSFVVPSRSLHAVGKASACLIDARTGRVVFTVSSDATRDTLCPSAVADGGEEQLLESVRQDLVKNVTKEVIGRMEQEKPDVRG